MDINKRFDQLESLLVDLARKQDQQAEQIARILQILGNHGEAINSLGELLNGHTEVLNSHTEILNSHTEILNSHTQALNSHTEILNSHTQVLNGHTEILQRQEQRLDDISDQIGDIINILKMSETRHTESERRQDALMAEIKTQSQRQDVAVEALRALLKRQENTDSRLDGVVQTQLQMLQLMRADANKLDGQEPRIKRLEDEVFREAS
jgi:chromosome segregation ATPase